jgi:glycosyltransferase involved in cell wall biosynthesis
MIPTAVIPAYNEEKYIAAVIRKAKKYAKIVVVDDGSSDKTISIAKKAGATVLQHAINLGKGAALKTGCDYAFQHGAKKIILIDSDGQHSSDEIPKFAKALDKNDIVFSYRTGSKKMPQVLKLGNWGLSIITSILFGVKVSDSQCGYRAFTADAYKSIRWQSAGFDADNEMIANVGAKRLKYTEIPIRTVYLDKYKGTTIIDGLKIGVRMVGIRLRW